MTSEITSKVKALYSVMQSCESRLGGGEGIEGLYGSISKGGMEKVLRSLREHTGLDSTSTLVDVGAGLGRPLLHALVDPGISSAFGIELDSVKCSKATAFVSQTLNELHRRGFLENGIAEPVVHQAAIEEVSTLDPATHAYSFWEGVPTSGKAAMGRLFAASSTLQAVAVVQRGVRTPPAQMMAEHGFGPLRLVSMFSVSMSGSGQSFKAYVFARTAPLGKPLPNPTPAHIAAHTKQLTTTTTPVKAVESALPRLRTRREPRITELMRKTKPTSTQPSSTQPTIIAVEDATTTTKATTKTTRATSRAKTTRSSKVTATEEKGAPVAGDDDAGDENQGDGVRTLQGPTPRDQGGATTATTPASPLQPAPPANIPATRTLRRPSLESRCSADIQSPLVLTTGDTKAPGVCSLQQAAVTATKVLATTRVASKQVSPVKAPTGLQLTGSTQTSRRGTTTRAGRGMQATIGGSPAISGSPAIAPLTTSMRQRRRGHAGVQGGKKVVGGQGEGEVQQHTAAVVPAV